MAKHVGQGSATTSSFFQLFGVTGDLRKNHLMKTHTRWAPSSYKWSYNLYKWPYKWLTVLITLVIGVINPVITGRGPTLYDPCMLFFNKSTNMKTHKEINYSCGEIYLDVLLEVSNWFVNGSIAYV